MCMGKYENFLRRKMYSKAHINYLLTVCDKANCLSIYDKYNNMHFPVIFSFI